MCLYPGPQPYPKASHSRNHRRITEEGTEQDKPGLELPKEAWNKQWEREEKTGYK